MVRKLKKFLAEFHQRRRWKCFLEEVQQLERGEGSAGLLALALEGRQLFHEADLSTIPILYTREFRFKPGIDSLYNLVLNVDRVCEELARDAHIEPMIGKNDEDYIRLDLWLTMPDRGTLNVAESYDLLSLKIEALKNSFKPNVKESYIERRCRRLLESYVTFCVLIGEICYGEKE